jgi:hypothetical protein
MDVVSSSLRRVPALAKEALNFVPDAGTKRHGQMLAQAAGEIRKVALLALNKRHMKVHPPQ